MEQQEATRPFYRTNTVWFPANTMCGMQIMSLKVVGVFKTIGDSLWETG